MKVMINVGEFNGKVEVQGGEAIISGGRDDFSVSMEEISAPGVKRIKVFPRDLDFEIEQEDGWIVNITKDDRHGKENLIVYKVKKHKRGEPLVREYLTTGGEWLPYPYGFSLPTDIMKIPVQSSFFGVT